MKTLVVATCIAVLAAVGHYFWTTQTEVLAASANRQPSDRMRERCEKDYRYLINEAPKPLPEGGKRYFAMLFTDCEEFGVFSSRELREIGKSQVGEAWRAYKADPQVWDSSKP